MSCIVVVTVTTCAFITVVLGNRYYSTEGISSGAQEGLYKRWQVIQCSLSSVIVGTC